MSAAARVVWVPGHVLLVLGWLVGLVGYVGGSTIIVVAACAAIFVGAQGLLWSGALRGYPRKRAGSIVSSVLCGLLLAFLVGLRIYAGPEAWSG